MWIHVHIHVHVLGLFCFSSSPLYLSPSLLPLPPPTHNSPICVNTRASLAQSYQNTPTQGTQPPLPRIQVPPSCLLHTMFCTHVHVVHLLLITSVADSHAMSLSCYGGHLHVHVHVVHVLCGGFPIQWVRIYCVLPILLLRASYRREGLLHSKWDLLLDKHVMG